MKKIGFIGAGQMARALASGFVASGRISAGDVCIYDPADAAVEAFRGQVAAAVAVDSPAQCVDQSDLVFLAVKPQHMNSVFKQVERGSSCLFVSIAAGVKLDQLQDGLGTERIIRVMPNTPCLVASGAAGYCAAAGASEADANFVGTLLNDVGLAFQVPEAQLDAVTGLSGSGPAFVYQVIEALSDGGVRVGLPRDVATQLAAQTVLGAAKMVLETKEHPGVLKDRVTSPGGTTIAGVHALEQGGLRSALMNAVTDATKRSIELGG